MATKRSQRIGIWIIAGALVLGTLGGFAALILAPKNAAKDQARIEELTKQYQAAYTEYQKKIDAQNSELSNKYYPILSQYASTPTAFDASSVKELSTNDLQAGTGQEIKEGTSYSAYYIGWNPSGKVFDQSIDGSTLKAPIAGGNLIEGWNKGVLGMKEGGVREITIPSAQAYGESGSGESIPPNTPLKFIVLVIEKPETIAQPEIPAELLKYYGQ